MSNIPSICLLLKRFLDTLEVSHSSISKSLREHGVFKSLGDAQAITKERKGGGHVWVVKKPLVVENYLTHTCPKFESLPERGERYNNIHTLKKSKAKARTSYRLIFTRSKSEDFLNGTPLQDTQDDAIGKQLQSLQAKKVCFVENLESFMTNKHLIEDGWVLVYAIGRIGVSLLEKISADEILHFGDLDYIGLNEYARIKLHFPQATLHVPQNYYEDARKVGMTITSTQKASEQLLKLAKTDKELGSILDFLHAENVFLEQEGYLDE